MEIPNQANLFLKAYTAWSEFRNLFLSNWKAEFFDLPEERVLFGVMKNFWVLDHKIPRKKDLQLEFSEKTKYEKLRQQLMQKVEDVFAVDVNDYTETFVRDYFLDALKKKNLQFAIRKIVEEVNKNGKVDESAIKHEILKSLEIDNSLEDLGIDYYNCDIIERMHILQELQKHQFKTGMNPDLDEILKLKKKTVVAFSAQLGVGKSMMLINLASNFTKAGYNVLYLSLEMDAYDHSKRLDMITFGFENDKYYQQEELVSQKMDEFKLQYPNHGRCYIRSYPTRSLAPFQIKSMLETYQLRGVGIDIVLVDYLTLMRPNKVSKEENIYMRGKEISEELQTLAKENNVLVVTALQVKGEAYGKNKQGNEMVAESLAIPQNLDTHINMTEFIMDDTGQKYFVLQFEKTRDSKKSNRRVYLRLENNLKIVDTSEEEKRQLDEMVHKETKVKVPKKKAESPLIETLNNDDTVGF